MPQAPAGCISRLRCCRAWFEYGIIQAAESSDSLIPASLDAKSLHSDSEAREPPERFEFCRRRLRNCAENSTSR
jgi:hypothetical protein